MKIEKSLYTYDNWNNGYTSILAYEINLINTIYSRYFDNFDTSNLIVSFDTTENSKAPICYKQLHSIVLNADIIYWCQVAYQYCHELCHYCIQGLTIQKFKWLEESICELASVYFMNILAKEWAKGMLYQEYSVHIKSYADAVFSEDKCKQFNLIDLTYDTEIFNMMATNQYNRDYNRTVAKNLLNVFQENPILWNHISKLGQIRNAQSLKEFLDKWGNIIQRPDLSCLILSVFVSDEISSSDKSQ